MEDQRYWRTSNFYCASFLIAKGFVLINIDRDNPRRFNFVFQNKPEVEKEAENYKFGRNCEVSAILLTGAIKQLKELIHGD